MHYSPESLHHQLGDLISKLLFIQNSFFLMFCVYLSYIIMKGEQIFDSPFIAYDNSALNQKMLDLIDNMKHLVNRVTILHVHDPAKLYIHISERGDTVFNALSQRYPASENPRLSILLKQMGEKTTNVIILENFVATSSSILFLGFVGSKGFKPRSKDLSSRIRQFVYQSKFNLAIVKHQDRNIGKVLFLLDGSQTSFQGLAIALSFCKRFGKQLTVLHTYNEDLRRFSKHVKILLKGTQEAHKQFKFQQVFEQKPLLDAVLAREGTYDWIILNKNGYRGSINKLKFIGSNTSNILENVNNNLIIIN